MKLIVAVSSKRDACKSFSTLDCHEECFYATNIVIFYKIESILYTISHFMFYNIFFGGGNLVGLGNRSIFAFRTN